MPLLTVKEYNIVYAKDPDWDKIPSLDVDVANWRANPGMEIKVQLAWNEDRIMFHGTAKEDNIRAEYDAPLLPVWEDSCLEYFFMPEEYDRYLNVEINPNGALYFGIGTNMPDRVRLMLQDEKGILNIRTQRTDDGWELYFEIPLDLMHNFYPGYELKEGNVLRANCMKCGDLTVDEHFLSWNQFDPEVLSFHNSKFFGKMTLVK